MLSKAIHSLLSQYSEGLAFAHPLSSRHHCLPTRDWQFLLRVTFGACPCVGFFEAPGTSTLLFRYFPTEYIARRRMDMHCVFVMAYLRSTLKPASLMSWALQTLDRLQVPSRPSQALSFPARKLSR